MDIARRVNRTISLKRISQKHHHHFVISCTLYTTETKAIISEDRLIANREIEIAPTSILNKQYNPTASYIEFDPNGSFRRFKLNESRRTVTMDMHLHKKYVEYTSMDILQSLVVWSLYHRNVQHFDKKPFEIMEFLQNIGFLKYCQPQIFTAYYSGNFIKKVDNKLLSHAYSNHSQLNFITTRSLQIFEFLHWRLLNNTTTEHVAGGTSHALNIWKSEKKYKSQLQINSNEIISKEVLKTLAYLKIDSLYLSLYDIALNDIESVPLSYTILESWINHGFHLFIAANPGHLSINKALNPLNQMYSNAFYHILSDKPRFVDVKKEYGRKIETEMANKNEHNDMFVFNMLFFHIMQHFGVGNVTSILSKVLLRCIISDRHQFRSRNGDNVNDLNTELCVFENKKFIRAFGDIFNVYGKYWKSATKDRLYCIIMRYLASVGEIDGVRYVLNMAHKYNYFGVADSAYNLIKLCEALNAYIEDGLFIDDNLSYVFHSDPLSGHQHTSEYFMIRCQQCIDLLSKLMNDRNNMLLRLAANDKNANLDTTEQYKAHRLSDADRTKLEKLTANYGSDITTVTHRILYCLNQIEIAIQQYEIANNTKCKFSFSESLMRSLVFIEKVHHKYPLSNDWQYLKLSEQKQMFLDIANGVRSGVLISSICQQNTNRDDMFIKPPTKILRLRLLNHYGALFHVIPLKDALASSMAISDITFNAFLQSFNLNILPHSEIKMATFFRVCSLYLTKYSLQNELSKNDVLSLTSKLLNILQYAVGDIENENKSTSDNYFLLNVKLLLLSIKNPYKCYLEKQSSNTLELKCVFCQKIFSMMLDGELIKEDKHFIPDLELSEMLLFEWFALFLNEYKMYNPSNIYKELFVQNNLMNDLLVYSISMKVFDDSLSHPLIFHLSLFCKFLSLIHYNHSHTNQAEYAQIMTDIFDLWKAANGKKDLFEDYCAPISKSMNVMIDQLEAEGIIEDISTLDELTNHLQQTWSPFFIEFEQNKKIKKTDKQNKRWKEMIEPQLMSILSPKEMRFINTESTENENIFEPLYILQQFGKQKVNQNQAQMTSDPIVKSDFTQSDMFRSQQAQFEEFVNSLDIEYLKHLMAYSKFIKTKTLTRELTVADYINNLNEDGIYVDPAMKSFITSIEPLIQTMKAQSLNVEEDKMIIDHSEVNEFLNEIEGIYKDLSKKQQKKKEKEMMVIKKKEFLMQLDSLLKNKPKLQSFLDGVQEIINQNKFKLRQKKKYSLSDRTYKPQHIDSEEINIDFEDWKEFELNIESKKAIENKDQQREHRRLLAESDEMIESSLKSNRMIGELNYNKVQKFLEVMQSLPIKSNMTQETYALAKLVKEIDKNIINEDWKTMELRIKTRTFAGWDYQCYRITNCKFIQYKKGIDSFDKISGTDSEIQQQHDVNDLKCTASLSPKNQPLLEVAIDNIHIFLSFDSYKEFIAWFRILFACKAPSIPSNFCFALYHLLQSLYKQSNDKNNTMNDEIKSHNDRIKQLHNELTVHQNLDALIAFDTKNVHINTLFDTLIFTLKHLPSSLFSQKCEQELTDFIIDMLVKRESAQSVSADCDKHIALLNDTRCLNEIKQKISSFYSAKDNRYGFICLLFIFLNHVSNQKENNKYDLATLTNIFCDILRFKNEICVKVFIFYAKYLFDTESEWKMCELINDSGTEKEALDEYNDIIEQRVDEQKIILLAQKLKQSVEIKTRKHRFKKYKKCFIGKEAIQKMIDLDLVGNEKEGIELGNALIRLNIIQHVDKAHNFKNSGLFYRFIDEYDPTNINCSLPAKLQSILSSEDEQIVFDRKLAQIQKQNIVEIKTKDSENKVLETEIEQQDEDTKRDEEEKEDPMKSLSKYKYVLNLEIIRVNDLPKVDDNASIYVAAKVLHKRKQTKRVKCSDSEFNETLKFILYEQPQTISVALYCEDKEIGDYELPLNVLFMDHPGYKTKLNLQNAVNGSIEIELKCKEMFNKDHDDDNSDEDEEEYAENMFDKKVSINIEMLNGHNLIDSVLPIKYNPFVVIKALDKEYKTKTIAKDENPKWNELIQFEFEKGENKPKNIFFEIYNERMMPLTAELIAGNFFEIVYSQSSESKMIELQMNNPSRSRLSFKMSAKYV